MTSLAQFRRQIYELDPSQVSGETALDRTLLIASGGWIDAAKATLSVHEIVLKRELERQAIPAAAGLDYWQSIAEHRFAGAGLFWLQTRPLVAASYIFNFKGTSTWYTALVHHHRSDDVRSQDGVGASKTDSSTATIAAPAEVNTSSVASFIVSGFNWLLFQYKRVKALFLLPIQTQVDAESKRLNVLQDQAATRMGRLLTHNWHGDSIQSVVQTSVADMAALVGLEPSRAIDTPDGALKELQAILDKINTLPVVTNAIPPTSARYWPVALLGVGASWWVLGNWRSIVEWFKNSVVETLKAFVQNWVYEPMYQIYLTVRHDPDGSVALMAKESLQSDLDSLVRMTVEFMADTTNSTPQELAHVGQEVRQGDLTPVLRAYEQEITTPVRSLLSGKLIRTLLIQIQKTKVDAEVALAGIDKLLSSQQLVFGLVAAIPSLLFVRWVFGFVSSAIYGQPAKRRLLEAANTKESIMIRLGNIENIAASNNTLDYADIGLIYCEVAVLKARAPLVLPAARCKQFIRDVDRLVGVRDSQTLLNDLLRMYAKYF